MRKRTQALTIRDAGNCLVHLFVAQHAANLIDIAKPGLDSLDAAHARAPWRIVASGIQKRVTIETLRDHNVFRAVGGVFGDGLKTLKG